MKRSPHPPEYTARGVYWGVFWGLTPLVGIQMAIVTAHWLIFKLFPRLSFHLIQGIAWVWISNVFTMVPMYYGFYVTGQLMLGRWDNLSGYDTFAKLFDLSVWKKDTLWETMSVYFSYAWEKFGWPLAIGWLPHALFFGWIAHVVALKIIKRRRDRITQKRIGKAGEGQTSAAE